MLSIDEVIAHAREKAKEIRENIIEVDNLEPYESYCNAMVAKSAEEHEQLAEWLEELKAIKEMDLSIPQNFTKEQIDWIKSYCIKRNIEFYNNALDDFVKFANTMPTVETEDGEIRPMRLEEMAEKLKAGVNK